MKCKDVMTQDPKCCEPSDSVEQAAKIMRDEDIGSVLICEAGEGRKLAGILTDRDIIVKVIALELDPKTESVGRFMSSHPISCHEEEDLDRAIELMEEHQVRRIPVLNEQNQFIGIISQGDIATRVGNKKKTGEVVHEVSKPAAVHQAARM